MILCVSEDGINYLQNKDKRTYATVALNALLNRGTFSEDEGIEIVKGAIRRDPVLANEVFHQLFEQGFIEDAENQDEGHWGGYIIRPTTPRKPGPKPKGSDSWRYE